MLILQGGRPFLEKLPKLKKKKELESKNGKKPQRPTYPECPTCNKTNHPAEKCWRGAGAHLRPKHIRKDSNDTEPPRDEDTRTENEKPTTSTSDQSNSKKPDSKN